MNLGNDPRVIQALGSNTMSMQEIRSGSTENMKLPAALMNALPTSVKPLAGQVTSLSGLASSGD